MNTEKRRKKIVKLLSDETSAVSASVLAEKFNVSRQIIVGDIAILRAEGYDIIATPRGYILEEVSSKEHPYIGTIACNHDETQMQDELYTIVDFGGTALDVTVEHSVYGQISGKLNLSSRYDVDVFIEKIRTTNTKPLSDLTQGIHIHKVGAPSKEIFDRVLNALNEKGIIL